MRRFTSGRNLGAKRTQRKRLLHDLRGRIRVRRPFQRETSHGKHRRGVRPNGVFRIFKEDGGSGKVGKFTHTKKNGQFSVWNLRSTSSAEETVLNQSDNESVGSSHHLVPTDSPELHDAVFVVGALDETIMLRGMRYHPIDIENSVLRCHKKIAEW